MSDVVELKRADYSHAFYELETEIREVLLAADIAFQMTMRADSTQTMHDRNLAMFSAEQCLEYARTLHKKYHELHYRAA